MTRTERFFRAWYVEQRRYSMAREDWLYCLYLLLAATISMGVGLIIGMIWARFI